MTLLFSKRSIESISSSSLGMAIGFLTTFKIMPPFIIHVREAIPYFDTDTMTLKNKPVYQVAQQMMKNLSEHNPLGLEFRPIRSNQSTLAGMQGWKIEAFLGPELTHFITFLMILLLLTERYIICSMGKNLSKSQKHIPLSRECGLFISSKQ
jgi:hypothetical protein